MSLVTCFLAIGVAFAGATRHERLAASPQINKKTTGLVFAGAHARDGHQFLALKSNSSSVKEEPAGTEADTPNIHKKDTFKEDHPDDGSGNDAAMQAKAERDTKKAQKSLAEKKKKLEVAKTKEKKEKNVVEEVIEKVTGEKAEHVEAKGEHGEAKDELKAAEKKKEAADKLCSAADKKLEKAKEKAAATEAEKKEEKAHHEEAKTNVAPEKADHEEAKEDTSKASEEVKEAEQKLEKAKKKEKGLKDSSRMASIVCPVLLTLAFYSSS